MLSTEREEGDKGLGFIRSDLYTKHPVVTGWEGKGSRESRGPRVDLGGGGCRGCGASPCSTARMFLQLKGKYKRH